MRVTKTFAKFNASQRHALDSRRNLAVRANAGSGKTSVLVERIVQLLDRGRRERQPFSLTALLALTFTRKAAAELQERLRQDFQDKAREATDPAERAFWKARNEELPRAMIGTIDSFCGRVLREFGFLDQSPERIEPDFSPLEAHEEERLKREAIDRVINRLSHPEEASTPLGEACRWWAVEQGYDALIRHLKALLDHLADPAMICAAHRDLGPVEQRVATAWIRLPAVQQLRQDREELRDLAQSLATKIEEVQTKTLLNIQEDVVAILDHLPAEDVEHETMVLDNLRKILLTQAGEKRSLKNYGAVADILEPMQETWHPLLSRFDFDYAGEVRAYEAADLLVRLLEPVVHEYHALCREANRHDFTTLARRTRDLLRDSPDTCRELKRRYRHVMVDEFQDTNQLQWDIICRLVGEHPDDPLDSDRLFVVGDPQQSIYRFRQADVGVFRRVQEKIHASNQHHGHAERPTQNDGMKPEHPSTAEQRLGLMPLGENYRSLSPMPLDLMDRVFRHVFNPEQHQLDLRAHAFEVAYQPLLPGLSHAAAGEVRYVIPIEQETEGDDQDGDEDEAAEAVEGLGPVQVRAVVDQLVELHGQRRILAKEGDSPALTWRDMTVLLPSRNLVLTQLEQELRQRGIPYVVTGGIGFWQRQEVNDVINLASYLADNGDELALFAVLRGPLGQCPDTEVLFLSQLGLGSLGRGLRFLSRAGASLAPSTPVVDAPGSPSGSAPVVDAPGSPSGFAPVVDAPSSPSTSPSAPEWRERHWRRLPEPVQLALHDFWAAYPDASKQRLLAMAQMLDSWRLRVDRMAHADLLQRALEESGAYALFAADFAGEAMLANLDRLFERIRGMEMDSAPDLNRLARGLRELREDVTREQQASLARDLDAVQIMTVHASKGLEFPVVAVLKMERSAARGSRASLMVLSPWDALLAEDAALAEGLRAGTVSLCVRHPHRPRDEPYKPQLLRALRRLDRAQELAESRRLFYVAATRAQERLILAGKQPRRLKNGSPGKPRDSWQKWFEDALGITESHKHDGLWENVAAQQRVRIITQLTEARPVVTPRPAPTPATVDLDYLHERPLHPCIATTGLEDMLQSWRDDPRAWWLRYRLQLRPHMQPPTQYLQGNVDHPAGIGTVVGALVHRLLEMPRTILAEAPDRLQPLLEAMAANQLAADDVADDEDAPADPMRVALVVKAVQKVLQRLRDAQALANPIYQTVEAPGEVEVPFGLRIGRWRISGRFDKLLRCDAGFEVVDWKTDADEDREAITAHHRPQMRLYALALLRAGQAAVVAGRLRVHLALLSHMEVRPLSFSCDELESFAHELGRELEAMDVAFASYSQYRPRVS